MSVCCGNGKLKVLLVDDEERHLEMYGALLEEEGYAVVTAGSGGEAGESLEREGALGLVVLDLRLPDVEGLDLFRSRVTPDLLDKNFYDRAIIDLLIKSKGHIKCKLW